MTDVNDRAERRTAAQALFDNEHYNRTLVAELPIGLALTRMNGELVDVNPAYARILGYSVEEVLGLSYWDITPQKYAVQERDQLELLQQTGHYGPYEKEYLHKDGYLVAVRLNGRLLKQGNEIYIWSSVEDISERVQGERAWHESEHRFAGLVSNLPGMFYQCMHTNGWVTVFASAGAKSITGYDPSYFTQQHHSYLDLVHPEDRHFVAEALEQALQNARDFQIEYRIIAADGREKWLLEQGQAINSSMQGLSGVEGYITDITQRKHDEQTIQQLAMHDPLTGLVNRYEFERRLNSALMSCENDERQHALLYLDLDRFKVVNDSCGHEAGDHLLKEIACIVHGGLRERDTLARLGGDEFGVLLENCSIEKAYAIAMTMVDAMEAYRFSWGGKIFNIGVSVGIAKIDSGTRDTSSVMRAADSACYSAKDLGRGRVCVYDRDDMSQRGSDARWVTRINDALFQDRFVLYAQPIVPIQAGNGAGVFHELLLRMKSTDGRLVAPARFIPAAERYNIMPAIDRWVVSAAFAGLERCLAGQGEMRCDSPLLSINLSGVSLKSPGFVSYVRDCMDKHRINPHCICFEITETVAVADIAQAARFIGDLKSSGCQFALDDFGTGFSSFAYLNELPVDYIKIDGSFVRKLASDKVSSAIVRSIVDIGQAAGMRTIAEYVEEPELVTQLAEMGVDYAQGYSIDRPAAFEQQQKFIVPSAR